MKRGYSTLEFVVAAVIILAFAGAFLYAFAPRLQKGMGLTDRFFPEKCVATGLTRDDYQQRITDAIAAIPPQGDKARTLYMSMKGCFPDAEVSSDVNAFMLSSAKAELAKIKDLGTTQSLQTAREMYDSARPLFSLDAWDADSLLLFGRAWFFAGSPEGRKPVDAALAKGNQLTPAQQAEALWLQAQLNDNAGMRDKNYKWIITNLKNSPDPDAQLYVGLALRGSQSNESIVAFEAARKSTKPYVKQAASYYAGVEYWKQGVILSAAKDLNGANNAFSNAGNAYWDVLTQKDSLFYDKAFEADAKLDEKYRGFKDCPQNSAIQTACTCKGAQGAVIGVAGQYCCAFGISAKQCACASAKKCEDYSVADCWSDPCGFNVIPQAFGAQEKCAVQGNACVTESSFEGGP